MTKILRTPIKKIRNKFSDVSRRLQAKVWPNSSIVFYVGETPDTWHPGCLNTGIGGAQARVIFLAREWAKLGFKVTVFNNCGDQEGTHDNVHYLNWNKFNRHDSFDTLIVWHFAWRLRFPVKSKRIWLDLGKGVLLPEESSYEKLKHYDKIFCKNNFHRSTLPEIPDDKIAIIPNGVDSRFSVLSSEKKEPMKIIYASNYSRGLEYMLRFGWPLILEEVPQAELHIFYGWSSKVSVDWKNMMLSLMQQPGITEHGKVGRDHLMREKSTASIHYYGCTFEELDCNTVRESALVGCIPVTTDFSGLKDKEYCVKVPGNPHLKATQEALALQVVKLLQAPQEVDALRCKFMSLVAHETWEEVASLWLNYL
ncbi:hypothetical protein [Leptolyngbya sp. PCC 6406]|uniref:hypothetical protein n=1 Tax=Leptolyngbya sp. PCC 6406 TaxID=1173264 RepID=UPI0002ACCF6D|nr:hypothetical protein [Leptolyngbya sp. PCC 6406]